MYDFSADRQRTLGHLGPRRRGKGKQSSEINSRFGKWSNWDAQSQNETGLFVSLKFGPAIFFTNN
jgi:hypothetical protein